VSSAIAFLGSPKVVILDEVSNQFKNSLNPPENPETKHEKELGKKGFIINQSINQTTRPNN